MNLEPLFIQALPRLSHTGSAEHFDGTLDLDAIEVGRRHFALEQGISYEIDLVNTGEALLLSGHARANLSTQCDRCLEPTALSLTGEVQGYFLFDKSTADDGKSLEVYEEIDTKGRIDIAPPVLAAIVVELPTVVRCTSDCAGIVVEGSSSKGTSPDTGEAVETAEDINLESPFAALKDLKFDD